MSAPAYNVARLALLESRAAALGASARGLADAANEAAEDARQAAATARRASLFDHGPSESLSDLLARHLAELDRLGSTDARDQQHARHMHQCRNSIEALRTAIEAFERERALRGEVDKAAAAAAPLRELVARCRQWAGLTTTFPRG